MRLNVTNLLLITVFSFWSSLKDVINFLLKKDQNIDPVPIVVEGDFNYPKTLFEEIPIDLHIIQATSSYQIVISVYVDGIISYTLKTIEDSLELNYPLAVRGLQSKDDSITVLIIASYKNNSSIPGSRLSFVITYLDDEKIELQNYRGNITPTNPTGMHFYLRQPDSYGIWRFDTFEIEGPVDFDVSKNRYIDLSKFTFKIVDSLDNTISPICELKLYSNNIAGNLLQKENYVQLEYQLKEVDDYIYKIEDDYRFYVDKLDGSIKDNYDSRCLDELVPLFIPTSCTDKYIDYSITLYDVGYSNSTIEFSGKIINCAESINDNDKTIEDIYYDIRFRYHLIDESLEVNYE